MTVALSELWRLRLNFFVVITLIFASALFMEMIVPTFHQYITNPKAGRMNSTMNYENYPGFEESEFFYSLALIMLGIGAVISSIFIGLLSVCLPYIFILLAGVLMHVVASLLYGLALHGWMLLIVRFLIGASFRLFRVTALIYIGNKEMDYIKAYNGRVKKEQDFKNTEIHHLKENDIQIKKTAFILMSISVFLPALFGPGISSVIAQIPSANLFRWIGYFNAICGVFMMVLVFTFFHGEYRSNVTKGLKHIFSYRNNKVADVKTTRMIVLIFLAFTCCVWRSGIKIVYTIFNPILSDSFGLTVKETSYYFTGLLAIDSLGSLLGLFLNMLKIFHPRLCFVGAFLMVIAGSLLIADWQTLGEDPCQIFSPFHYRPNSSISCEHYTSPTLHSYCMEMQMAAESSNWTLQASELCQATQGCHWNQFSVISNSLCTNCPAICRNVHKSLNIIQFSVGAMIYVLALPIGDTCLWLLFSNNLQDHEQGPFIGIANGVTGVVGIFTPMWIDALYERFHKRTVVPMAVNIVLCTITLIGLLILYRVLDPRESRDDNNEIKNGHPGVMMKEEEEKLLMDSNIE